MLTASIPELAAQPQPPTTTPAAAAPADADADAATAAAVTSAPAATAAAASAAAAATTTTTATASAPTSRVADAARLAENSRHLDLLRALAVLAREGDRSGGAREEREDGASALRQTALRGYTTGLARCVDSLARLASAAPPPAPLPAAFPAPSDQAHKKYKQPQDQPRLNVPDPLNMARTKVGKLF